LKNKGYKNIHYVKAEGLTGNDLEETVDGVHLTDLGFSRMAESLYPVIRKHVK
jgi:lysophospholipase L1-like esterase